MVTTHNEQVGSGFLLLSRLLTFAFGALAFSTSFATLAWAFATSLAFAGFLLGVLTLFFCWLLALSRLFTISGFLSFLRLLTLGGLVLSGISSGVVVLLDYFFLFIRLSTPH